MKVAHAVGVLVLLGLLSVPGAAASPAPAAPANLEVVAATEDSLTLAWGPSQPGPFVVLDAGGSWVAVGWGPSQDPRGGVVGYEVSRDGGPWLATSAELYRFSGRGRVRSFRLCVRALNAAGQRSAPTCGTMTRA